ncbi:hypothetical protein HPB50_019099 [Hyalomma asiaticum]|uniref:Uncharacterized protein n=1 Tax=Hyalomma asiaticum TaxID=266040 RepID=A0ACB7SNV3_HYAAI|nr:hypothetical protein HPB50_019099 [Hyalomma asiaticum]
MMSVAARVATLQRSTPPDDGRPTFLRRREGLNTNKKARGLFRAGESRPSSADRRDPDAWPKVPPPPAHGGGTAQSRAVEVAACGTPSSGLVPKKTAAARSSPVARGNGHCAIRASHTSVITGI